MADGLPKNTFKIQSELLNGTARNTIPDSLKGAVWEVKGGKTPVYRTGQIQAQYTYARKNQLKYNLIVSPEARVTGRVAELVSKTRGQIFEYNPVTGKLTDITKQVMKEYNLR